MPLAGGTGEVCWPDAYGYLGRLKPAYSADGLGLPVWGDRKLRCLADKSALWLL